MMAIQRTRAERAMKRSSEAKQRNREFDKRAKLEERALANKGNMDVQKLQNQGWMDATRLKEEGDTSRTKMDLDWKTGNEARNFAQRENQFERAFQQTQSIADRSADQWLKTFEETKNENKLNRQDKLLERATKPGDMGEPAPGITETMKNVNRINRYGSMSNEEIDRDQWNIMGEKAFSEWGKLKSPEEMVRFAKSATPEVRKWFKTVGTDLDVWEKKKIDRSGDYTLSPYGL